jgi:pilus assembly protein Flp/PilA
MRKLFSRFSQDKRGVTAIEYGLIAAFIALLIIGGVSLIGTNLSKQFSNIAQSV